MSNATAENDTNTPTPPIRDVGRLSKKSDIKREMARVFRDSVAGRLTWSESSKAIFVLRELASAIDAAAAERAAAISSINRSVDYEFEKSEGIFSILQNGGPPEIEERAKVLFNKLWVAEFGKDDDG